jgi:hypothetical protein
MAAGLVDVVLQPTHLRWLPSSLPSLRQPTHVTRLYDRLPGQRAHLALGASTPQLVTTPPCDYKSLFAVIRFTPEVTVFDPWFGGGSSSHHLREVGVRLVLGSDICPRPDAPAFQGDGLLLLTYDRARRHFRRPIDIVLCSPWFVMLDLAIPVAYSQATQAAIIHVPFYYTTQGTLQRLTWLSDLTHQCLAYLAQCGSRGNLGYRSAWLLLFKSAPARDLLVPSLEMFYRLPPILVPPTSACSAELGGTSVTSSSSLAVISYISSRRDWPFLSRARTGPIR